MIDTKTNDLAVLLQSHTDTVAAYKAADSEFDVILAKSKEIAPYPAHALLDSVETKPDVFFPAFGVQLIDRAENEQEAFSWADAYKAWETGQGVQLAHDGPYLSKLKGDACPQVILDVKQWTDERTAALETLDYDAHCTKIDAISDSLSDIVDRIYAAPANSVEQALTKLKIFVGHEKGHLEALHHSALQSINNDLHTYTTKGGA